MRHVSATLLPPPPPASFLSFFLLVLLPSSPSFPESAEHAHHLGAAYSGGDCEREVAVDADSACSYAHSVDVIVVPPAAASSSERAMLAATYTVAVIMRQHAHLPDAAPQSGEHGGRVAAADDTSLHTAPGEQLFSYRVADLNGHVHPSLALSLQAEQQQQLLYRDNLEKRPVDVDARLPTTTSTSAAEQQSPAHASPHEHRSRSSRTPSSSRLPAMHARTRSPCLLLPQSAHDLCSCLVRQTTLHVQMTTWTAARSLCTSAVLPTLHSSALAPPRVGVTSCESYVAMLTLPISG